MTFFANKRQHIQWSIVIAIIIGITVALIIITSPFGMPSDASRQHADSDVNVAALTNNGKTAIVIDKQNEGYLWKINHKSKKHRLSSSKQVNQVEHVALAANGQVALLVNDKKLTRWNLKTNTTNPLLTMAEKINAIAISANGQYALMGLNDGSAEYISLNSGNVIQTFKDSEAITSVALSPDNQYAFTGSINGNANLWDIKTGKKSYSFSHQTPINKVVLSNKNRYALTHSNNSSTKIWDIKTGELLKELDIPPMIISSAKFSPNDELLAIGSKPQVLLLVKVKDNKIIKKWILPKKSFWKPTEIVIHDIVFTPQQKNLQTEDSSGYWRIWKY